MFKHIFGPINIILSNNYAHSELQFSKKITQKSTFFQSNFRPRFQPVDNNSIQYTIYSYNKYNLNPINSSRTYLFHLTSHFQSSNRPKMSSFRKCNFSKPTQRFGPWDVRDHTFESLSYQLVHFSLLFS